MLTVAGIVGWCCYKVLSAGIWGADGLKIIHVSTHCDEEVKEELAALLHLILHCCALLEVVSVSDDDSEIVTA